MRKTLLALVVLGAVVATGCGGGTAEKATEQPGGATQGGTTGGTTGGTPPAPPTAGIGEQSSDEVSQSVKFVPDDRTPASFKKLLRSKKPIVVHFYLPGDPKADDVNREFAPLKKRYAKEAKFVSYDINETGSAVIGEQLKAGYDPYFVIIDKGGFIVYRHSGYVDRLTLEQAIFSTLRR